MSTKYRKAYQLIVQQALFIIGWSLLRPVFLLFLRPKIVYDAHFKYQGPYIVTPNHLSYLDSLCLGLLLPLRWGIYPINFVAEDFFFEIPFLGTLMRLLGAYPKRKGQGLQKSLEAPLWCLKNNCSVIIFPQGWRRPTFDLKEGRKGAAAMALESGRPILPIALFGIYDTSSWDFFLFRKKLVIMIGHPLELKRNKGLLEEDAIAQTPKIMIEIDKLYRHAQEISKKN